jgi:hypothetical protein
MHGINVKMWNKFKSILIFFWIKKKDSVYDMYGVWKGVFNIGDMYLIFPPLNWFLMGHENG